ncbi:MAG: PrsW family intramembrane metalloprotease [Candidatus Saccharimonadales bacterium]
MLVYFLIILFIALSAGLVAFLLKNDRGAKEPAVDLWFAAGIGLAAAIVSAIVENLFIPVNSVKVGAPLTSLITSFLVVAVIEETLKFLPLALFVYPRKFFNEHTDGIIYFAIVGLGFGLPENILYTLQFGAKAGAGRLLMTPFFHAAITSVVGYNLAKAKLAKKNPLSIWPVFILAIALHALYDFGLSSGTNLFVFISVTITLALSANFFYLYFKASDKDEDLGLATAGHNKYCRSCGSNNHNHYLYCTNCGQRA